MACRFVVKEQRPGDEEGWARVSKVGRVKLGARQGDEVDVSSAKSTVEGLVVHQGLTEDSGAMVVRLGPGTVRKLGVKYGDTVDVTAGAGSDPKKKSEPVKKRDDDKKKDKKKDQKGVIEKGRPEVCVLVIDCSESMRVVKFEQAKKAAESFLDAKTRMQEGDLVGCVGFDGQAYTVAEISKDYERVRQGLPKLNLRLGTDIGIALEHAMKMILASSAVKKDVGRLLQRHIILLADGNGNPNSPPVAARECRKHDIIVDVVGIVDGKLQEGLLKQVAELTGGRYRSVTASNVSDLARLYRRFANKEDL